MKVKLNTDIQNKIDWAIKQILDIGNPVRIYLFGSYAKGLENENSDLDFCILEKENLNSKKYYKALFQLNHSKNIIIRSFDKFESLKSNINTIEYDIYNEGILLYERKS